MSGRARGWWRERGALVALALWLASLNWARADSLVWHAQEKKIDAQIETWDLGTILKKLATATGWQIYVEPNAHHTGSVRFKNLPLGEGLKRILGDLNFALLPRTNAPARLFVFRTSAQEATQLVADEDFGPKKNKSWIPNELVVTLRAGSKESAEALAKRLGAKVLGKADALNTYRLQFADAVSAQAARDTLAADPNVAGTDWNFRVDQPTRTDGLQSSAGPGFNLSPKLGNAGKQTIIGLIDTPVQPLDSSMSQFMLPAVHVAGDASVPQDQLTHGTSMAETILRGLSYAPPESGGSSVRILPVDVYGSNPDTTTFDVAKGVYAAVSAGATVINLSLGGAGDSQVLDSIIHAAHQQGVMFFGAAGNQPTTDPTYPAAFPDVVAVTAGDQQGNIASYANRGSFVDLIAPGTSVVDYQGQSYLVRGTSAATAYVSGTAAGFRAEGAAPQNVQAQLQQMLGIKPRGP